MNRHYVSCQESESIREGLVVLSALTNYVAGEVLDPNLPAYTGTTWGHGDGTEVLRDERDEYGCRHWLIRS